MLKPNFPSKNVRHRAELSRALLAAALTLGSLSSDAINTACGQPPTGWLQVEIPEKANVAPTPSAGIIQSAEVAKFHSDQSENARGTSKKPTWLQIAVPGQPAENAVQAAPIKNPFFQQPTPKSRSLATKQSNGADKRSRNATYRLGQSVGKTVAGTMEFDSMEFRDLDGPANGTPAGPALHGPNHHVPHSVATPQATTVVGESTMQLPPVNLQTPPAESGSVGLNTPSGSSQSWMGPTEIIEAPQSPSEFRDLGHGFDPSLTPDAAGSSIVHDEPIIAGSSPSEAQPPIALVAPNVPRIPQVHLQQQHDSRLEAYRNQAYAMQENAYQIQAERLGIPDAGQPPSGGFDMWWEHPMPNSIGLSSQAVPIDIATLTRIALVSSPYVRSLLAEPRIRRSEIVSADAEFDPIAFLNGRFTDTNEPVGSTLTTGDNSDRFIDETLTATGGVRRKTRQGGLWELSQKAGFQDNNSTFLDPNPQGTTRLEFNFSQPLLRDRGRVFNNTRILLAQLDYQIGNAIVRQNLEEHLIGVTQSYWELYQARAEWLQRSRLLKSAEQMQQVLKARDGVDSQQRQILRAGVAVAKRRSELVRAVTRIQDAQSRLRLLTGSAQLKSAPHLELAPQDQPFEFPVDVSTRDSLVTALDNRADIAESLRKIQTIAARVGAAKNQVLPQLDLILGTYVAGLDGNRSSLRAFGNQFTEGRPTYWAGMVYELPIGNRGNKAVLNRSRWEYAQAVYDFQQATDEAFTEIEIAARETKTAYNEMLAKKQAIDAASREVAYLKQRWEFLPEPNDSAILLIENMLDSQERLADEESGFVRAQVKYALSWIQLRKAMGVLLKFDQTTQLVDDSAVAGSEIETPATIISSVDERLPAEPIPSFSPEELRDSLTPVYEDLETRTAAPPPSVQAPPAPPAAKTAKKPWWRFKR